MAADMSKEPTGGEAFAVRNPQGAARIVVRAAREGGDVADAWRVLASAVGAERALVLVYDADGKSVDALTAVAQSLAGEGRS